MSERSFSLRALLFLYSNANILGCALALLGPVLLFTGLIHTGWLLITAGLYAMGYLLARRAPELERRIEDSLTVQQTIDKLDEIVRSAKPFLTDDMAGHLSSVRSSVAEVLPKLAEASVRDNDWFTVRETVLRYLPETLANYAALPPAFRMTQPLQGGQTARQLLTAQLTLLDTKMKEVVNNVAASDAQALLANGKFLEAKFQQPDFLRALKEPHMPRTIIDIPDAQLREVDRLCQRLNISRAEAVRRGLGVFLEQNVEVHRNAFALWKGAVPSRAQLLEKLRSQR